MCSGKYKIIYQYLNKRTYAILEKMESALWGAMFVCLKFIDTTI